MFIVIENYGIDTLRSIFVIIYWLKVLFVVFGWLLGGYV